MFYVFRQKAKKEVKSASHRVVPEIEHLLENTYPTDIHDLGSHTVSITHLGEQQKVIFLWRTLINHIGTFSGG